MDAGMGGGWPRHTVSVSQRVTLLLTGVVDLWLEVGVQFPKQCADLGGVDSVSDPSALLDRLVRDDHPDRHERLQLVPDPSSLTTYAADDLGDQAVGVHGQPVDDGRSQLRSDQLVRLIHGRRERHDGVVDGVRHSHILPDGVWSSYRPPGLQVWRRWGVIYERSPRQALPDGPVNHHL